MGKIKPLAIYVISDSLADNGDLLAKASRHHFDNAISEILTYSYVREISTIDEIVAEASASHSIIVSTVTKPTMMDYLLKKAGEYGVKVFDAINPFLNELQTMTGATPNLDPTTRNPLDTEYFDKIEAIDFTVKYDDGKRTDHLDEADIILLGVSRSSKTPISIYLANNNYKVANFPILPECKPAKELFNLPKEKIFGLILDSKKLISIREERLKTMGLGGTSNYASEERVNEELDYATNLFNELGCTIIDVTSKAIEEIANFILANIRGGN